MNPNFLHFNCSYEDAAEALASWYGKALDASQLAIEPCSNRWTSISLDLGHVDLEEWRLLAKHFDIFYEPYSTSLCGAEIVVFRGGQLVRHLLFDDENPDLNVNLGSLPSELANPLHRWSDVWGFVDDWAWEENVAQAG